MRTPACLVALVLALAACESLEPPSSQLDWTLVPDRIELQAGQSAEFTITIQEKQNINSDVELRATGLPTSFGANFSDTRLASTATTATLTVTVPADAEVGTYSFDVRVQEVGGVEISKGALLIVTGGGGEPDFSLELDPVEVALQPEVGKTFTFFVRPLNGFLGTVVLQLSGLGDDLFLAQPLTPNELVFTNSGGMGGTFVLRYVPNPPVTSPVTITVTATSGGLVHSRTATIVFPPS